nr:HAD-IB family phosphatase [Nocardioides daejeonensis]
MTANPGSDGPGRLLHVFDMDGTLLQGSATIEIARQLGVLEVGRAIEDRWARGAISDDEFWQTLLEICADADEEDIDAAFHSAPWMAGMIATFADIRERGEDAIVISQSPAFFVSRLERWGVTETYGSAVEIRRPLRANATLSADAKLVITEDALARRGLEVHECIAYGDSSSDLSLFAALPHTVGVNPRPALAALAARTYVGGDIGEAYRIGRALVAGGTDGRAAMASTSSEMARTFEEPGKSAPSAGRDVVG